MVTDEIQQAQDALARQGITVTVCPKGDGLCVHVVHTSRSRPATWYAVFAAFLPTGLAVHINGVG
jgi:hypothetical protein